MGEMSARKRGEIEPLLKENRIDESPDVRRTLDRLITATPAERGLASGSRSDNVPQHGWNTSDATLVIDQELLARLKRAVKLDGDR
jgi:hypothetical protein